MENKKESSEKESKKTKSLASIIKRENKESVSDYRHMTWTGTFWEYLELVEENPKVIRNAYQRLYDMISSYGTEVVEYCRRTHLNYNFFKD